ncbi:MAG TPA: MFS transporter [Jatrophihabitantaceae bacterium]|nr:MFS transporter [Jatrophihabitantaceae bacterium]
MRGDSIWRDPATRQLAVVSTLGFTSFFLTLSSLATWAVKGGASSGSAGAVTAVMLACTVLVQTAVPSLERRWGLHRVLALGLIALGAPAPLYALSSHLGWLVAISAVRGGGFAILTVLGSLLTARIAAPSRHGDVVGAYGLSIAVPSLIAVPAGVALTLGGHFTWVAVLACSPLLALPVLGRLTRAASAHPASTAEISRGSRAAVRASATPAIVLGAMTAAGGGLVTFLPIERPHGVLATVTILLFGLTAALSRWLAAALLVRIGRSLMPGALVIGVVGLVAVSQTLHADSGPAITFLSVGAAVFGVGYGIVQSLTLVAAFDRAGAAHAITASSVWNIAFDAGTAVGAYGVGAVAAAGLGLPRSYLLCALLVVATAPLAVRLARRV